MTHRPAGSLVTMVASATYITMVTMVASVY